MRAARPIVREDEVRMPHASGFTASEYRLNVRASVRLARPVVCVSEVQQLFRNTELQQGVTRARVDYDQSLECCRLTRPLWITRVGIAGDGCDQRAKRGVASSCACTALPAHARRYIELFAWPGEQNEV